MLKLKLFKRVVLISTALGFLTGAVILAADELTKKTPNNECVFLVHGLGRTKHSMMILRHRLRHAGYRTVSFGYNSRKLSIEEASAKLEAAVSNQLASAAAPTRIHFVTHSLGGILVRNILAKEHPNQLGRVVMISPPNHGSEIPDKLGKLALYRKINGPAGIQLGTSSKSMPNTLPPADFPVGIITGDRSFNPLFSHWIPGKDDGKVSIESAKLDGMRDFVVVHSSHTWIMNRKTVRQHVLHFLQHGNFQHKNS